MHHKDFTLDIYKYFLEELMKQEYSFQTCEGYVENPLPKVVILRHDIDLSKHKALETACIEQELGLRATYYFRLVKASYDPVVIRKIVDMGHELGYHYEDFSAASGDYKAAIQRFEENLALFRNLYPVRTVCMHGSPLSKYDNRLLWKKYDYRDFGIVGEPYYDIDFNEVLYLTDTGRCWNAGEVSIRDKVESNFSYNFKSTYEIINNIDRLPPKIMLNVHPQRWHDKLLPWCRELVGQNIKNIGKYTLAKIRT